MVVAVGSCSGGRRCGFIVVVVVVVGFGAVAFLNQ